jgi:type IV secretion system protein VirB1
VDFLVLAQHCAPMVHPQTMTALVRTESGFNPFAIGVVGGRLVRQPRTLAEAVATARSLEQQGYNWSGGYGQVNRNNFRKYGVTVETVFEPCRNLQVSGQILAECFVRARARFGGEQPALRGAFSCYYSGNFSTGFRPDFKGQPSYVNKVEGNAVGIPVIRSGPQATARMAEAGQSLGASY